MNIINICSETSKNCKFLRHSNGYCLSNFYNFDGLDYLSLHSGEKILISSISSILFAVQPTVPPTPSWNPAVGIIISICCLVMVLLAPKIIRYPQVGPKFPGHFASKRTSICWRYVFWSSSRRRYCVGID